MKNCLQEARLGRSAARHLDNLVTSGAALTEAELLRCIRRIRDGFDAVLGVEPDPVPPPRGPFTVVRGGLQ